MFQINNWSSRLGGLAAIVRVTVVLTLLTAAFLPPLSQSVWAASAPPVQVPTGRLPNAIAVNELTNKAYVVNNGDNNVSVIDGITNSVASTIRVGRSPVDVAIDYELNIVYVVNFNDRSVSVIDGETDKVVTTIPVGTSPGKIAVDSNTHIVYLVHNSGNIVTLIDGNTQAVAGTAANDGLPNGIAVNDVTHKVYIANSSGKLTIIGPSFETKEISFGSALSAIGVNKTTNKVYVTVRDDDQIKVIDGETDTVRDTLPSGDYPRAVAINEVTNRIYVANGDSSLTVVDGSADTVTATAPLISGSGPQAAAVDPGANKIYIANNSNNSIAEVDGGTLAMSSVNASGNTLTVAINKVTHKAYFINRALNGVSVFYTLEDTTPPTVSFAENGRTTPGQTASSKVTVTDLESGLQSDGLTYVWSKSETAPSSGYWAFANGDTLQLTTTKPNGLYYLHIKARDKAGNQTTVRTNSFLLDSTAPTVSITGVPVGTVNQPFPITVTFSEEVSGFDVNEIQVSGGALTGFEPVDAMNYTVLVTPSLSGQTVTLRVAANAAEDAAGNKNTASSTYSVLYDTTKPTVAVSGFTADQVFMVPPASFSVTASEALYRISDGAAITAEDAALLIGMEKDHAPFAEYTTVYDESASTYTVTFDEALEDGVYTVNIAGGVVKNARNNTLDAVSASFTVAVPAVTGITANSAVLDSEGGDVNVTVAGSHLAGQTIEVVLDGEKSVTANVIDADSAEAVVTIPANLTTSDKLHQLTVNLNGTEVADVSAAVTVSGKPREEEDHPTTPIVIPPSLPLIDKNGVWFDPAAIDSTKPSYTLEVAPKDGVAYVSIPASILTRFEKGNAAFFIEIKAPYGSYRVPVNLASLIQGLQDLLAANKLTIEDISFKITLTDKSGDADIQAAFAKGLPNGKVLGAIVDLGIEIMNTKTGKTIGSADQFSQAIVRIIPMPKDMTDLPAQWGAFRYNEATKQFEFVPARKVQIDGIWYVMISSNSNSVYVVAGNAIRFADTQEHWGKPYVELAAAKGLVDGVGGGRYAPDKSVTRAEFAAMLVRALGRSATAGSKAPFVDVKPGSWYYEEVAAAKELGLLDFVQGSKLSPNQPLTREEMASMLAGAVYLQGLPITGKEVSLDGYTDIGSVDGAFLEDVRLMVQLRIMEGTSSDKWSPKKTTTRAEAAAVFVRTLKALGMID